MRRRLIPLLLTVFLVGCGDGGEGTSKEEFSAEADSLCADAETKLDPLDDQFNDFVGQETQPAYEQASGALDQQDAIYEQMISDLEALTPPEGDEASFQQFVESIREEQRLTRDLSVAVVEPSVEAYDAVLDQYNQAHIRSEGLGQGYGFEQCGS